MHRLVASLAVAATLTAAAPVVSGADPASTPSGADDFIIQAKDHADLNQKYCAANPNMEHVLVLPAELFVDSEQLICDSGPYKMYRIVEHDDTDDFEYFIDPPIYGQTNKLGCDGKAGKSMKIIAVNCRPLK